MLSCCSRRFAGGSAQRFPVHAQDIVFTICSGVASRSSALGENEPRQFQRNALHAFRHIRFLSVVGRAPTVIGVQVIASGRKEDTADVRLMTILILDNASRKLP